MEGGGSSCGLKSDGLEVGNGSDHFEVHVFQSSSELIEKLHEKWRPVEKQPYPAMYSSVFGGIILDPALMVIPIDDHMVHRGHGVFDTAVVLNGYLYELDAHLDRFLRSASNAKISSPFPRSTLRSILVQLAAASKCKIGTLRYWLSSGPGNFLLTPQEDSKSAFYAVVIDENVSQCKEGVKVITSTIPMKSPQFATMKNVNYLPNVLSKMEAEETGAFASIWVDKEGYIAEGPNVNVAFITHDNELVMPFFDKILSGCTVKRLIELAPKLVEEGHLKGVKLANLSVKEAKGAKEMMYVGSTLPVLPIIAWDDQPVGDDLEIPTTIQDAWKKDKWWNAILEEMDALEKKQNIGSSTEADRQDGSRTQVGIYSKVQNRWIDYMIQGEIDSKKQTWIGHFYRWMSKMHS